MLVVVGYNYQHIGDNFFFEIEPYLFFFEKLAFDGTLGL